MTEEKAPEEKERAEKMITDDITDDGQRKRLATMLQTFGLARIQYSAFRGELNANDRAVLARRVSQFVNDEHDSIFIIPLCDRCTGTAEIISNSGACLVTEELRGWSWDNSPLKPYHDVKLPMYSICSKYCPTSRDVYLRHVLKKKGEMTYPVSLGSVTHAAINETYRQVRRKNFNPNFEEWYNTQKFEISMQGNLELIKKYAGRDMIATSAPFLIEHKISGELIGCSGILSVDCYDYLHNIMFDVKTGIKKEEVNPFKLYATGYALVFESIYEVPVDIGCTVFLNFKDDRLLVERDLFHISDDLRSWWIEERDKKLEMVYEEKDPGMAECERRCMYEAVCRA